MDKRLSVVEARSIQNEENLIGLQSIANESVMREKRLSCQAQYNYTNEKGISKNLFNIAESKPTLFALTVADHLWPKDEKGISDLMKYRLVDNQKRDRNSDRPPMSDSVNLNKWELLKSKIA